MPELPAPQNGVYITHTGAECSVWGITPNSSNMLCTVVVGTAMGVRVMNVRVGDLLESEGEHARSNEI